MITGSGSDPRQRWTVRAARRRMPLVIMLIMFVAYGVASVFQPLHRDLRRFDPAAVAKLETKMWRSYYDHERTQLFFELAEMLRTQSQFPLLRSYVGAYYGSWAAFVFKDGRQRTDYEKALPALQAYFGLIRNTGRVDFDARRAAALELEWWIVHRERASNDPATLGRACAEAGAFAYQVPVEATLAYGQLRAAAMLALDTRADKGRISEADWTYIEALLCRSYQALRLALVDTAAVPADPLRV